MSVPAKRRSKSKGRRNRAHLALRKSHLTKCPKCGQVVLPHRVCSFCGTYKDREVIKIKIKKEKK